MICKNFRDIEVDELTKEEKDLIRFFRNMHGQHGVQYSQCKLKFTDGVATTEIWSEDEKLIDIISKLVHWDSDKYIDSIRLRNHKRLIQTVVQSI